MGARVGRSSAAVERGAPPARYVLLYDGHCAFCEAQSKNLARLARPGAIERVSFQDPGVLDRFPGVTYDACMRAMHLIAPDGRVFIGFEAVARALATRPVLKLLAYLYYLPGVRFLCDRLYEFIAARRYRIMGRAVASGECGDACAIHLRK